jgi:hypothetical protein
MQADKAKDDLVRAAGELKAAEEHYNTLRDLYASTPSEVEEFVDAKTASSLPQFESSKPLIDMLGKIKEDLAKLKIQQRDIKPANKAFYKIQKDIDSKTRDQKDIEEKLAKAGVSTVGDQPLTRRVMNPAKIELKEKVTLSEGELNVRRLQFDDAKKRSEELAEQAGKRASIFERYNQLQTEEGIYEHEFETEKGKVDKKMQLLEMVTGTGGNPYFVTDGAVPSDKPVEPPVAIFLAAGLFGGAGAGLGLIFLREFVRSGYRNVQDAATSLSIPVLGFVQQMATRSEIRRNRRRHFVGVSMSLAAILLVGGSASLYLLQPKLLPASMKQAIDSVKTKLR